ncbi:hypothetical protein [Paludibacterium paludis]|uniref:PilZ domain-containing protein n=1 Tax=Paludibacterium paludis TaxID=1225769 RepID=A0A918UAM5_9NEIS|nr:hypothetical protein [Paludibacterium paludis]GGY17365.1 hypothetical protein GCM10011289_20970 [Paludibacterium paludis]
MPNPLSTLRALLVRSRTARHMTDLATHIKAEGDAGGIATIMDVLPSLTRLNADTGLALMSRVEALLTLDRALEPLLARLGGECRFGQSALRASLPALLSVSSEMAGAYLGCVTHYLARPAPMVHEKLRLATLRGLHFQLEAMLYKALRYLQPSEQDWKTLGRLYLFADEHDYARTPFVLSSHNTPVTAEALLIQAALLNLSQPENLLHKDIAACDVLLSRLRQHCELTHRPSGAEPVYRIDPDSGMPPERLAHTITNRHQRFLSLQPASTALADLALELENRAVASETPGQVLTREQWLALIRALSVRWTADGGKSLRRADRQANNEDVRVTDGLPHIALALQFADSEAALPRQQQGWRMVDESESGLGLFFPGALPDLAPGRLVLVRKIGGDPLLGVIRRLARQTLGTRVGVELLGDAPLPVSVQAARAEEPCVALYVPRDRARGRERWLLLPPDLAHPGQECLLHAQGKTYRIELADETATSFDDAVHMDFATLARLA